MASRREQAGLPTRSEMLPLVLELLRSMPMPVHRLEIGDAVAGRLQLTPQQRAVPEPGPNKSRSFVSWQSEYACNDLKWIGVCEQPGKGLYQLTEEGWTISIEEIERRNRERQRRYRERRRMVAESATQEDDPESEAVEEPDPEQVWRRKLIGRLLELSPSAFEHLAQRLLEAAGFDEVQVTGKSGDGGIDGIGVYRPLGLISFHTAFQCKRYQGSVSASVVRDFRGSFVGRADRGIVITTGEFTEPAREEASRPGANPVDLVDGETLCELLRDYRLGVKVTPRTVEDITINNDFFDHLQATT